MKDRAAVIDEFLTNAGWGTAIRHSLAGDASSRRYERLIHGDGRRAVLMDAPPETGEDVRPFVRIAQHLRRLDLSAPAIFVAEETQGLLLLEDLGDDLFANVVVTSPELQPLLYKSAADVLIALQNEPQPDLEAFDAPMLAEMTEPVFEWYQSGVLGQTDNAAQTEFEATLLDVLTSLLSGPPVMIMRDYHAENLLWLPERQANSKVGLLDFQDAKAGHPAYDLVSLLQDARRNVPLDIEAQTIAHYLSQNSVDSRAFRAAYAALGVQRNLRIIGVFSRLCLRDGKVRYIDFIPRIWEFVQRNLQHPALADIAPLIQETLPAPTSERLQRLKDKCATIQTP